jgi:hypothetical protein
MADANGFADTGKKILEYAPTIGGAIGGVALPGLGAAGGVAAGKAIQWIAGLFGIKSDNPTPQEIDAAISADPQAAEKLRALDIQFKLAIEQMAHDERMAQMETANKEFLATVADTQNARQRQIDHEKATGHGDWNLYLLAWMFVAGFFITLITMTVLICTESFPTAIPDAAIYLLGSLNGCLTAGVGAVIQYFFGKNKDSNANVQALSQSIPFSQLSQIKNMIGIQTDSNEDKKNNGGGKS